MKKLVFLLLALFCQSFWAQNQLKTEEISFKRNEVKLNMLYVLLGGFEGNYERILDEESAIGIGFETGVEESSLNYAISPYYRYYFGEKPAAGFFGEVFGTLNSFDELVIENNSQVIENKTVTDFALGIGLGGKWVTRKGLIFELNIGVGRNLFQDFEERENEFIGRVGVSIGYRF